MTEQIYNDFTTKLLPEIAKGLTITKEYFSDLFGRYVTYLTISDALYLTIFSIILIILLIVLVVKQKTIVKNIMRTANDHPGWIFLLIIIYMLIIGTALIAAEYANDLIKDRFIPEIRVYETLSEQFKNNNK
ncbi:MAG: hypothetical protein WC069_05820 [Candidatus Shapirobacteria bacterium]